MPAGARAKYSKRKASSASKPDEPLANRTCKKCRKVLSRTSDLRRHMKIYFPDAEKLPCPWEDCNFRTLQKSNLETHLRTHNKDKPFVCTDDPGCDFRCSDPASLLRHRKTFHGYIPWSRSSNRHTTGQSSTAPSPGGPTPLPEASIDPSPSGESTFAMEPFFESFSPSSSSQFPGLSTTGTHFLQVPSHFSPFGESGVSGLTSSSESFNGFIPHVNPSIPSRHWQELPIPSNPPPYNYYYPQDTVQSGLEFNFPAADPDIEQLVNQMPSQSNNNFFFSNDQLDRVWSQWSNFEFNPAFGG